MRWVATECSRNDGSKTQYYIVILDQLQGRSGALERAPESRIRGPLTKMLLVKCGVMLLENFLQKYSMGYMLYPWILLLESVRGHSEAFQNTLDYSREGVLS